MLRLLRSAPALCLYVCLVGSSALVGCGDSDETSESEGSPVRDMLTFAVDELGPYQVGYRTFLHTYSPHGVSEPRTIRLNLWYPTLDTEGPSPTYMFIFQDTDVFEGASLAPSAYPGGYPVQVYSHGWAGFGGTSSNLMHYFASHGWVLIAPDHTGNTLPENTSSLPITHYFLRPQDITAALDVLEGLPSDDPLSGKALTEKVMLSGHSFGTFTTWATGGATFDRDEIQRMCDEGQKFSEPCTQAQIDVFDAGLHDGRVVAGMPMAGGVGEEAGWFGFDGYDAAGKPFLLMSGTEDQVGAENVFARAKNIDLTWLEFEGACHQAFALGGCPNLEENEGWAAINTYALAFARRHVLGDPDARITAILDGTEAVSPKVAYHHP